MKNTDIDERYELVMSRFASMEHETYDSDFTREYFTTIARYVGNIYDFCAVKESKGLESLELSELEAWNSLLYRDVTGEAYYTSIANPGYLAGLLPEEYRKHAAIYAAFAAQVYAMTPWAYEGLKEEILSAAELAGEVYYACREGLPSYNELKEILYWYVWDYLPMFTQRSLETQLDPGCNFFGPLAEKLAATGDLRYLYMTGEFVSSDDAKLCSYVNSLPWETVNKCAVAYTEGYRKGFAATGKDITIKSLVQIRYPLGLERIIARSIELFREMGLESTMFRNPVGIHADNQRLRNGVSGSLPSKQYRYDHMQDLALIMDRKLNTRRLEVLDKTYEKLKLQASAMGGPAIVEEFGDDPFFPAENEFCAHYDDAGSKMRLDYENRAMEITCRYIPQDERSYTYISFPSPAISEAFEEVFEEVVRINTLDVDKCRKLQQKLIDTLNEAEYVAVRGMNGNRTELKVAMNVLKDPEHETNFENCTADVNIPAGEVFTTPMLTGTTGILHVKEVYLNRLKFMDLELVLKDGRITDYSCGNFENREMGRRYIKDNILKGYETLPMSEFAIGTNTLAYAMIRKYGISDRMDILITEKTGPHFAFGDTCYSYEEDIVTFNPDGKAIVARENDYSRLRNTDPEHAYFHHHIDVTIPYDELGELTMIRRDGTGAELIKEGRFVLEGTETLNEAFNEALNEVI